MVIYDTFKSSDDDESNNPADTTEDAVSIPIMINNVKIIFLFTI
jgi:hypothetical protein